MGHEDGVIHREPRQQEATKRHLFAKDIISQVEKSLGISNEEALTLMQREVIDVNFEDVENPKYRDVLEKARDKILADFKKTEEFAGNLGIKQTGNKFFEYAQRLFSDEYITRAVIQTAVTYIVQNTPKEKLELMTDDELSKAVEEEILKISNIKDRRQQKKKS
ncbi:MAG: hypothetical protein HYV41_03920 [Candidatus Magasanikbacteria bacterium]|nr:hypothetical protein [Candidatus Magasanikbacteria bacterium]